MGIAAYNRGSKAHSAQIDREQAEKPKRTIDYLAYSNAMEHTQRLQAQIATLENDLTRARRSIASLRATSEVDRKSFAEYHELMEAERKHWLLRSFAMQRRWEFVSRIVRTYVSPETVEEYRAENPEAV